VGEYTIETRLGAGGFGTVYQAVHRVIGKRAAVKVLHRKLCADPPAVSRFVEEARAVNRIGHKHIVDIFSFGQLPDGRHYHVMELLEGRTLAALLEERGVLPPDEALAILAPIARALDAAHTRGIAHRDLKPENVLLVDGEEGRTPKLIDFGLAKVFVEEAWGDARTKTGALVGTPEYMSPEQCRGRTVDHKTDVYAFGVLAYRMLVGQVPFRGADSLEVMMKQATEAPLAPSRARRELPQAVDAPLLAMLEKRPERRPADLAGALAALEAGLRARRRRLSARGAVAAGAAVVLAGTIVVVGTHHGETRRPPGPEPVAPVVPPPAAADSPVLTVDASAPPAGADAATRRPRRPSTTAEPPGPEDVEDPFR
jgi:serine/threonine-protein kinase